MRNSLFLLLLLLGVSIAACKRDETAPLSAQQLEDILYEVHKADALGTSEMGQFTQNEFKKSALAHILRRHNVTNDQYDSAMAWYGYRMEHFYPIYTGLIERFTTEEDSLKKRVSDLLMSTKAPEGDTVNLWVEPTIRVIHAYEPKQINCFRFTVDASYQSGDRFLFRFLPQLPGWSGIDSAQTVTLGIFYGQGEPTLITQPINNGEINALEIESDSTRSASYLFGLFRLKHPDTLQSVALLSDLELWRYHRPGPPPSDTLTVAADSTALSVDSLAAKTTN